MKILNKQSVFLTALLVLVPATVLAEWEKQKTFSDDIILTDVWGSSNKNIFAVGRKCRGYICDKGAIVHYNGISWSEMDCPLCGDQYSLRAVWGSSTNNVFAVGVGNVVLHYNGIFWINMNCEFSGIDYMVLNDIWGSSKNDVWAVGSYGQIFHYDGTVWSGADSNLSAIVENSLFGVWGSSSSDVFAVGYNGLILHYNGISWSQMDSNITSDLYTVWGSSATDVWTAGAYGTILHYDGYRWTGDPITTTSTTALTTTTSIVGNSQSSQMQDHINDIWGSSADDIYAVGSSILHYDGHEWSAMDINVASGFSAIWGASATSIYAVVSNNIYHYNGLSSTIIGEYSCVPNPCLKDPCLPGLVWAVVTEDEIYYLTDNGSWIWDCNNYAWNGWYVPRCGAIIVVLGQVSEEIDNKGNTHYNLEVEYIYPKLCLVENLYGGYSKEAKLLRHFRDHVLDQTPEGRELINLYYQWSPVIVRAMEEDKDFKEAVNEMFDGILPLIRKTVE